MMKSLNYKLVSLYVISVFIIVTAVFLVNEYVAFNRSNSNATQLMEMGPGYINGATLPILEEQARSNGDNIYDLFSEYVTGSTATSVLEHFRPVFALNNPVGRSENTSITILPELFRSSDNYYLLEDASSEIGPLIISDNYFPFTISSFVNGPPWRRLYYSRVAGYDDLVIIGALDIRFQPEKRWLSKVPGDVILVSPLVLVAALLLGSAITRMTVSPITRLTRFSETLAAGALDTRTSVTSKDELGRLAHSLNRMAARLQETFDSQKRFISDAAHEMRTPLASMKIAVTGALTNIKTDVEHQQLLDFLARRISTQERLIADLLLQARADENDSLSSGQPVDITGVITGAAREFDPVFEDRGIRFQVDMREVHPGNRLYVKGDPAQLSRLFSNLIDNAAKNTPSGGQVSVELTAEDDHVVVRVRDTGRGIAPEHLDKIFDRFYKVSEDRTPESGFGLGLSISRGVATRHGGEITVESVLGKGSVFTIRLPLFKGREMSK